VKTVDLEKNVNRILSGKQLIEYQDILYELRSPSMNIKLKAGMLYDQTYEDNLYSESFILEDSVEDLLLDLNILYPQYKADLSSIEKKMENLKVDLFTFFFDRNKKTKNKTELASSKKRYNEIYILSHSLDFLTLENYCSNIKNEFIISNSLYYYETNNLVFQKDSLDYDLFNNIINKISSNILDIETLKAIARSDFWRNYYSINKNHLLPYSIVDFSEEQKAILSISTMYDRVYEHPECPEKEIVEDDDALEGWMICQQRENKKQKQEKGVNNILNSDKMKKAGEVFLMANTIEERNDILGLNTQESAAKRQSKINTVLNSTAPTQDSELPDVKQDIRNKLKELSFSRK
jgi:hypothetical protein